MAGGNGVNFYPAFPNPTSDIVKLVFDIPEPDTISIFYEKTNGDTSYLIYKQAFVPGHYNYSVSGREFTFNGRTVRFFIRPKNISEGGAYCRYYGDVQFY